MPEWNYVIAAYVLTWIGIVGYAVHAARRLAWGAARLNQEQGAASETE